MGSGKSAVGARLAASLRVPFIDLDREIVRRSGKEVPDIFVDEGEEAFRRIEEEELKNTILYHRAVVAVGGGALANLASMTFARNHGLVVYLRTSPTELAARLMRGQALRPMLQGEAGRVLDRQELLERISGLLAEREPVYALSNLIVDTDGRSVVEVADTIRSGLGSGFSH